MKQHGTHHLEHWDIQQQVSLMYPEQKAGSVACLQEAAAANTVLMIKIISTVIQDDDGKDHVHCFVCCAMMLRSVPARDQRHHPQMYDNQQ